MDRSGRRKQKFSFLCHQSIMNRFNVESKVENNNIKQQQHGDIQIVKSLIDRTIGNGFLNDIILGIQPHHKGVDYFYVGTANGMVTLLGNNAVNLAQAFNYYLKYTAKCSITWTGNQCQLRAGTKLPLPANVQVEIPHKYRYYMNTCTFGYSTVWWDWERWEREIDWMALNGYNLPLAQVGQEYVWNELMLELGLRQDDINKWFTGPAFLPWNRMGNLDGWGGVLPQSWIKGQHELQIKILKRMSEYGMSPVFPGFAGHVPVAFKQFYPSANIVELPSWHGFNATNHLLTTDPMYDIVADRFYQVQNEIYGAYAKIDYFSIDPFNELIPPSNSSQFLNECSSRIFNAINRFNPDSTWVLQNWFLNSAFWGDGQVASFLGGVPIGRLIVLDLWSELKPLWNRTANYQGHKWIWNMLHNFGGRPTISGRMPIIANEPLEAKASSPTMVGIGLTPEAIEQNVIVYDLMSEMGWRSRSFDLNLWVDAYVTRRYGVNLPNLKPVWKMLAYTVYFSPNRSPANYIAKKPSLDFQLGLYYNPVVIVDAWRELLAVDSTIVRSSETYRYDLAEITLQALSNYFNGNLKQLYQSYYASDFQTFQSARQNCSFALRAMDAVADTVQLLKLGKWTADARKWATDNNERELYEYNARNQITLWGWKDMGNPDYANKWWSGLIADYYFPRWQIFFEHLEHAIFDKSKFNEHSLAVNTMLHEERWNKQTNIYPSDVNSNDDVHTVSKERKTKDKSSNMK
ncbi:hypothetical protein PPL_03307 [Heterostelium album PN500]|uniref:Alpha-N-acetylglucosaminidase n=1 Tax=Heterostelium pallidum (strain ATCC 26659 / Pp 5 / PN500) TaxID=670386 RepID=D3B4I2_HETP5|nr:hypothetical protein PPL_03307 [Heterostelium album PN500]EFA84230.1 hypothetical protein PPL_03307 [Heterostelium album PN500]|eukprot:XP_020436346.1 hypothetical protein PPL_03307 [Heterostelium album PN500]